MSLEFEARLQDRSLAKWVWLQWRSKFNMQKLVGLLCPQMNKEYCTKGGQVGGGGCGGGGGGGVGEDQG